MRGCEGIRVVLEEAARMLGIMGEAWGSGRMPEQTGRKKCRAAICIVLRRVQRNIDARFGRKPFVGKAQHLMYCTAPGEARPGHTAVEGGHRSHETPTRCGHDTAL